MISHDHKEFSEQGIYTTKENECVTHLSYAHWPG